MIFAEKLDYGKVGEGLIAQWLMARGNLILPVYEVEKTANKGPQLFSAAANLVSPDLVAFTSHGVMWIEAKHKTVFTWHRNTQHWTTGIDLRHYEDYMEVAKQTKLPVWLMFFHRNEVPSDSDKRYGCPSECPTGLYGGDLLLAQVSLFQGLHVYLVLDEKRRIFGANHGVVHAVCHGFFQGFHDHHSLGSYGAIITLVRFADQQWQKGR